MCRSDSIPPSTEIENIAERGDGPSESRQAADAASLPQTAGGDPLPPALNGANVASDLAPPPAIEGMAPLTATAMSSFASAANGVTTGPESTNGTNGAPSTGDGKVVLNGVSST
jgi:poly(A) polymerase